MKTKKDRIVRQEIKTIVTYNNCKPRTCTMKDGYCYDTVIAIETSSSNDESNYFQLYFRMTDVVVVTLQVL